MNPKTHLISRFGILALAALLGGALAAQDAPEAEVLRVADKGDADKAAAPLRVVIPGNDAPQTTGEDKLPDAEPEPEQDPEPPVEEPPVEDPEFIGVAVGKSFIWVLDYSLSMGVQDVGTGPFEDWNGNVSAKPSRLQVVQAEAVKVLRGLDETYKFGIVFLAGCSWAKPVCDEFEGCLAVASPLNVSAAIERITTQRMWLGTPTYTALRMATHNYGHEIDNLFFLSDGAPTSEDCPGNPAQGLGSIAYAQRVINKVFPAWYAPMKAYGCKLTVIHIGNDLFAGQFMTEFANINNAAYIKK